MIFSMFLLQQIVGINFKLEFINNRKSAPSLFKSVFDKTIDWQIGSATRVQIR